MHRALLPTLLLLSILPALAQDRPKNLNDSALLDLTERQTFRYFWDFAHPVSGMARERSNNTFGYGDEVVTTGGTGFGVMAMIAATDRKYIGRDTAAKRLLKLVSFLMKADSYHGVFPHWMNGATGRTIPFGRKDDGADLVETSYLMQGLLCARQYFNGADPVETALRNRINSLWNDVEWSWFTRGGQDVLYWHWSPNNGWAMNFPIRGFNECLITYILAASGQRYPVSADVYHHGWAESNFFKNGKTFYNYVLPLGFDYGGPLFFSQYSFLGLDPHGLKDRYADYWEQNTHHTLINHAYCVDNPKKFKGYGENCWGLTACDTYNGYNAYSPTNDEGTIAPTAALAAFPYTPEYSMKALRHYYNDLGDKLWGPYGFYDAFNQSRGWYASSYLAIDEGPIVVMIENYRSGLLWRLFMSCPEIQAGLKKLGFGGDVAAAGYTHESRAQQKTYCNPINLDYGYTPIPDFTQWGKHRATADPAMVNYKGDFYLFSTNQWGYWWSSDMLSWKFMPRKFLRPWNKGYDELCAPAVGIIGDTMIVFGSTYTRNFTIWMSTDPKGNQWKPLVDSFAIGGWDPAFFTDDDGRLYMYNGSSNSYPVYGVELDRKTLQPIGGRTELFLLHPSRFGWQRFGEYLDNTFLDPFIEGSWMTKYKGKYYLQYGAPGTEFSGYADGVVVGNSPLGPFDQPQSDPFSFHPGGFARGAGHGSTFTDNAGHYWHISTITISVKNSFERRLGIWPAGFDKDGVLYMDAAFGDYPHYLDNGRFTGWMLLNYKKPVTVSSTFGAAHPANDAVDEDIKTYWSAATGDKGEWLQSDLGASSTVNAIQINYADQDAQFLGKQTGIFHQYRLLGSADGKKWQTLIDKSHNTTDVPHDYVELAQPARVRYVRLENIHMPTGKFAISGLRVFGRGDGPPPDSVNQFFVLRTQKDKRSAWIKWQPVENACGYNIYFGTAPDKLYNTIQVNDANDYWFKVMDKEKTYYFSIVSFNENGVSLRKAVIAVD